jgi:outer membrane receptor protein involved in Fe transport
MKSPLSTATALRRPFSWELDKEKGKSFEIGSEYFPLKNLKLAVTLYRLDMEDEIQYFIYDPILYLGENRYVGKTRHDGAEISVSYLWEKTLRVYGNFTYARPRLKPASSTKKKYRWCPTASCTPAWKFSFRTPSRSGPKCATRATPTCPRQRQQHGKAGSLHAAQRLPVLQAGVRQAADDGVCRRGKPDGYALLLLRPR